MARSRPLEVRALVPLLDQNWESPEALADACIKALDEARASSKSYVAVIQIGGPKGFYVGMGPYPGVKSARNALKAHPALTDGSLATGWLIACIDSPEGFKKRLAELDTNAMQGAYLKAMEEVRKDGRAFRRGWDGKRATRDSFLVAD